MNSAAEGSPARPDLAAISEVLAPPARPRAGDVHAYGDYVAELKRKIFRGRHSLKGVREEMQEVRDEEMKAILEARLEPTQKQKDKGESGSLKYPNDEVRDRALRDALRTDVAYRLLREQESAHESGLSELEIALSEVRRNFPVALIDYLARQPVGVQGGFAGLQALISTLRG